jgi:hypothetical protein
VDVGEQRGEQLAPHDTVAAVSRRNEAGELGIDPLRAR